MKYCMLHYLKQGILKKLKVKVEPLHFAYKSNHFGGLSTFTFRLFKILWDIKSYNTSFESPGLWLFGAWRIFKWQYFYLVPHPGENWCFVWKMGFVQTHSLTNVNLVCLYQSFGFTWKKTFILHLESINFTVLKFHHVFMYTNHKAEFGAIIDKL